MYTNVGIYFYHLCRSNKQTPTRRCLACQLGKLICWTNCRVSVIWDIMTLTHVFVKLQWRHMRSHEVTSCGLKLQTTRSFIQKLFHLFRQTSKKIFKGLQHWSFWESTVAGWVVPGKKKISNAERVLTHWGRDKMDDISQTTFEFRLKFHWSLFLRVQLTIFHYDSDNGLAPSRQQAIIWANDD